MRPISISLRLTLWFTSILLLGSVLFGVAMWFNLKLTLTRERHLTLARRVDRLQELLSEKNAASPEDRAQDFKDFARATGNGLCEVVRPDGTRVFPSPSSAALRMPWPDVSHLRGEVFLQTYSDGQVYRVLARPVRLRGEQTVLLAAASDAGNLLTLKSFLSSLFASVPLLLLLTSASGYWISRRALRPVDAITAMAQTMGVRNLSERLPVLQTGDELQRMSEIWNVMLDRLEATVKRLKQFTADASHELRGPLSSTRIIAEVALRNPAADAQSRLALQDIVLETVKSAALLEEMLTLARADTESFGIAFEPVDFTLLVQEACCTAQSMARQRGLTVHASYAPQGVQIVMGNASSLRRLVWILLDNALKYTPAPGQINVNLTSNESAATLSVQDTGVGISADDLPLVFDRFYRADPSRSMVEGNGLGLSIARWIANTHQADLSVISQVAVGSLFTLRVAKAD